MGKNELIIFATILVLIFGVVLIIKSNTANSNNISIPIQESTLDIKNNISIEDDFNNAIAKCRNMYKEYGSQNFDVYFSTDFISNNMEKGKVSLVNSIDSEKMSSIEIYDIAGNKLEDFSNTFTDGTELKYEMNSYKIEENKTYLIKLYSYDNGYNYYYTMKINKLGYATWVPVCYTIGEIDEDIIYELTEIE